MLIESRFQTFKIKNHIISREKVSKITYPSQPTSPNISFPHVFKAKEELFVGDNTYHILVKFTVFFT